MRVLFFSYDSPIKSIGNHNVFNGGGWVSALQSGLSNIKDMELAIAFATKTGGAKIVHDNISYYPVDLRDCTSFVQKVLLKCGLVSENWVDKNSWRHIENECLKVVEDYKPDVIEVFGSETSFGLIASKTKVPVILHIQGILTPCLTAYLPPFVSWQSYLLGSKNPKQFYKRLMGKKRWIYNCKREQEILKRVKYYIGRTTWDKRVIKLLSPNSHYFYGGEILRKEFYTTQNRKIPDKFTIVTISSKPLYKGFDMILKTAYWLKNAEVDFEWQIYGNVDPSIYKGWVKIRHEDVNIKLMGIVNAEQLCNALLHASAYVHPSYIDNSPNSLCEAQIMGCPVIAANVGGVSSLIEDGVNGYLVPANDPFQTAYLLQMLANDKTLNLEIGKKGRETALARHNPQKIVDQLIETYKSIIKKS